MKNNIFFYPKSNISSDEKNIFIGEWIKDFVPKKISSTSHFINYLQDSKFSSQEKKINQTRLLSDNILNNLYIKLNEIHGISWKLRSWKYLIGPWLEIFIAVIYDRLEMANSLLESKKLDQKELFYLGKDISLTTYNYKDFTSSISSPQWNEKLLLRLLYILSNKDFSNKENLVSSKIKVPTIKLSKIENYSYQIKNFLLKICERFFCKFNNFVFFIPNIGGKLNYINTLLNLKQLPFFYSFNFLKNKTIKSGVEPALREKLTFDYKYQCFEEKIIISLISESLPTVYLEGFRKLRDLSLNSFLPKKKNITIITQSVLRDNVFKFWVADKINDGAKLVFVQHGSGYGYKKCWQNEIYEIDISDKFLSWGWKNKDKILPVGNISISKKKKYPIKKNKSLLIISGLNYIFKINNCLFDTDNLKFLKKNFQFFFDNLNYNNFESINIREHPQNQVKFNISFSNFFNINNNKVKFLSTNLNLENLIKNHSLVVTTYDSTEFYYMIARNKPCLQIFQKKFIKEEYLKEFNEMYNCGILHEDTRSLVKKINSLGTNIYEWWNSDDINFKKNIFTSKFINTSINYSNFYSELEKLKN